jgi:hypothetical protein
MFEQLLTAAEPDLTGPPLRFALDGGKFIPDMLNSSAPRSASRNFNVTPYSSSSYLSRPSGQGCQIFLGPNMPKWEKYTK